MLTSVADRDKRPGFHLVAAHLNRELSGPSVSIFTEMFKHFIEYLHCVRLSIDKSCRTSIGVTECAMGTLTLPVIRFMCFTGSL